jgi:hypothetical protein
MRVMGSAAVHAERFPGAVGMLRSRHNPSPTMDLVMKPLIPAAFGLAAVLAFPQFAAAQADVLTAKKLACTPERIARCETADTCEFKPASDRDKTQPLVFDFGGKKASMRREGSERPVGDLTDDKVEGDVRVVVLGGGGQTPITFRIAKDGKAVGTRADNKLKMEIACKPE